MIALVFALALWIALFWLETSAGFPNNWPKICSHVGSLQDFDRPKNRKCHLLDEGIFATVLPQDLFEPCYCHHGYRFLKILKIVLENTSKYSQRSSFSDNRKSCWQSMLSNVIEAWQIGVEPSSTSFLSFAFFVSFDIQVITQKVAIFISHCKFYGKF